MAAIQAWVKVEIRKVLSSYPVPKVADVPHIISLMRGDLASEMETMYVQEFHSIHQLNICIQILRKGS